MGQSVGKPIIDELTLADETEFYLRPMEFIHKRFEVRESIEEWGFLWAHKIIEENFQQHRKTNISQFDIKEILCFFKKESLLGTALKFKADADPLESTTLEDLKEGEEFKEKLAKKYLPKYVEDVNKQEDELAQEKINIMMDLLKKMWNGV